MQIVYRASKVWYPQVAKSCKSSTNMLFIVILLMIAISGHFGDGGSHFVLAESNDTSIREGQRKESTIASIQEVAAEASSQKENSTGGEPKGQQFRLSCQPGEQRQFSYESSTRVWGSAEQQVRLRATLRLKCMEPPTNTTLKYLAEIVALTPNFLRQNELATSSKLQAAASRIEHKGQPVASGGPPSGRSSSAAGRTAAGLAILQAGRANNPRRAAALLASESGSGSVQGLATLTRSQAAEREAEIDQMLRAEPLLGEVGEAATRVGRSLSGWFSKAWVSVKDFFGSIFTSSERSSISRDQAFKESGLDIIGQCKASSSKGRLPVGLPFDESVFEDLGPEYYIGASLDGASAPDGYEFSAASGGKLGQGATDSNHRAANSADDNEDELAMSLSFFDDPALPASRARTRRASSSASAGTSSGSGTKAARSMQISSQQPGDYGKLIAIPFVFVQSRAGKIIEIRFSGDESDLSVKNFKRHLCDLFATNLDWNRTSQSEVSPIGKHQTNYQLDSSANSIDSIKESALKLAANSDEERSNKQQLVRVLAMVGTPSAARHLLKEGATAGHGNQTSAFGYEIENDNEMPGGAGHGDGHNSTMASEGDDRQQAKGASISVLRSINTTASIQLSSKMLAPDIDRIQVRVEQVQQIDEGRLVGTAGQLSMTLVQMQQLGAAPRRKREARDERSGRSHEQVEDIVDLLRVSTSFSMQLVPIPRNPDGSIDDESQPTGSVVPTSVASPPTGSGRSATSSNRLRRETVAATDDQSKRRKKRARKSPLVRRPPDDSQELQRILQKWRKQEARLQLSSSNLVAENNGQQESQQTRLEILRDQIRQRLNEEFVRNRIRRSLNQQQVNALQGAAKARSNIDTSGVQDSQNGSKASKSSIAGGDLGLGLTQLVLGSGVTTKRKGSIYPTIEEVMELEERLAEDQSEQAISKLLRNTIRMDKLKQHCKGAIPSLEELDEKGHRKRASSSNLHIERRLPFGFNADEHDDDYEGNHYAIELGEDDEMAKASQQKAFTTRRLKTRSIVERFERLNEQKLEQCQNVLQLMLKLSDRRAIELVIDLVDECNQRLLAAAKQEELGYGPISKFYRRLRQRFVELLSLVSRPSDSLLDKLLARLYYPKLTQESTSSKQSGSSRSHRNHYQGGSSTPEPEFVYVNQQRIKDSSKYNKSLLKEEDDFNNSDGAALLVMTITSLAAKSSITRLKRVEVAEKLLQSLKGTSCSLFSSPDLDIIESMASFQEPLDEIVGRILHLARKCKQHDQYVVACVHGLSGQLQHSSTQRFLVDLLKSQNASCTIKSEIVLTLIGAQLANDFRQFAGELRSGGQADPSMLIAESLTSTRTTQWPGSGLNKVDETLLELLDGSEKHHERDRRCLKQLIDHYMSKKHHSDNQAPGGGNGAAAKHSAGSIKQQRSNRSHQAEQAGVANRHHRGKRAVINDHNFWDEAQCKRWSVPSDGQIDLNSILGTSGSGSSNQSYSNLYNTHKTDLIDEIDDNSILTALMNRQDKTITSSRGARRNQKLIERELDSNTNSSSLPTNGQHRSGTTPANVFLRKRHKCVASKDFGPKNAQANLRAEIVNDLIGATDENKFLARFRLSTNFLGNRIDVGRMYLWHQRRTTRAYANILGRSIWDSSHSCKDKAPNQVLYMPLFDFNLWLVKVSVGLRLNAEMGFFPNCDSQQQPATSATSAAAAGETAGRHQQSSRVELQPLSGQHNDELQLYPTISLRAAGEATAKLVVARAGMSLASRYSYQGDIRVSRQPESCMSVYSSHQPMNITFSSWFQLWDNDCHFWGSRGQAEPQAIKWSLMGRKPIAWLEDECLVDVGARSNGRNSTSPASEESQPPPGIMTQRSARSAVSMQAINRIDP